jgi:hypothetical protein
MFALRALEVYMKSDKIVYKPYRPVLARIANALFRFLDRFGDRTLAQYEEKVIEKVRKKTGLHDFGDESFHEPLRIICELTRHGNPLTVPGRMLFMITLHERLTNKLKINAEISAHPEILQEEIKEPIFIGCLPRTGSTLLHRLLAQDPAHRAPLSWEASEPAPPPDPATYMTDPRIKKGDRIWKLLYYVAPEVKKIHESAGHLPEECFFLMNNDLISWWVAVLTGDQYLDYLLDLDYTFPYRLHKRQLQLLQWKFPKHRWVLKTPSHVFALSGLLDVYPDARFVHLHRDPLETLGSIASLFTKVRGAFL